MSTIILPLPRFAIQDPGSATTLLGGNFIQILEKGGPVLVLILMGSVIGLALAFERWVATRKTRLLPAELMNGLRAATERRDVAEIERLTKAHDGPLSRIIAAGLERRTLGLEATEKAMEEAGAREVARLRGPIRPIAILATIEPLLGLLGTVLGMISTFNALQNTSAAERVERLAPGIGEALYTTVGGLCAAIPFVIAYHYLLARTNRAAEAWSEVGSRVAIALMRVERPELVAAA